LIDKNARVFRAFLFVGLYGRFSAMITFWTASLIL